MKYSLDGQIVEYEFRESERAKRPRIDYRNGRIRVTLPKNSGMNPEELLEQKRDWVLDRMEEAERFQEKTPERSFEDGEKFSVLGEEKEIRVEKRRGNEVGENIFLAEQLVEKTSLKEQLEKTLRGYAREKFQEKAGKFSEEIEGEYGKIYVRDQETRWGSCSGKNNLNFNWRLVLAPEHVFDYVVVHELVHLEIRNHSQKFWDSVGEVMPEYEDPRQWLEENSARLVFDSR